MILSNLVLGEPLARALPLHAAVVSPYLHCADFGRMRAPFLA